MAPPLSDQGAYLLGAFFNCILFGVLSTQVYLYHLAFGKDHKYIKAIVYSIYAIELAETIIVLHCTYVAVALGWGNDAVFEKTQPIWVVPTISAIVMLIVQCYYAYCLWLISGIWAISAVIVFCSLGQLAGGIMITAMLYLGRPYYTVSVAKDGLWHFAAGLCDIIIVGAMTHFLLRRGTYVWRTQALIRRIIRLMVETGLVITIVTVACTIINATTSDFYHARINKIYVAVIGKLYATALLVLINSRMDIGENKVRSTNTLVTAAYPINMSDYSKSSTLGTAVGQHDTGSAMEFQSAGPRKYPSLQPSKLGQETPLV